MNREHVIYRTVAAFAVILFAVDGFAHVANAQPEKAEWKAKQISGFNGHAFRVDDAVISPDGRIVASTGRGDKRGDADLKLWDAATGKEIADLPCPKGQIGVVRFSANGQFLAYGAASGELITIWDTKSRKMIQTFDVESGRWNVLSLNSDASQLLRLNSAAFHLVDVKTGETIAKNSPLERPPSGEVAVSSDLKWLAYANSQDVDVWDIKSGKNAKILSEHRGNVKRVVFSRDGKTLVSASVWSKGCFETGGQIKLWDVATGKERLTIAPENYFVVGMDLSPAERTLVLIYLLELDTDRDVVIVDVPSGKQIIRFKEFAHRPRNPVFVDETRVRIPTIATGEKSVHVWEISR